MSEEIKRKNYDKRGIRKMLKESQTERIEIERSDGRRRKEDEEKICK